METQFEKQNGGGMSLMKTAVVPLAVIGGIGVLWNKRRNTKPERSIDKVMHTIQKSELPERTKKRTLSMLDDARDGLMSLRESAGEMTKRSS
jgi:hypothetical protein